MGPVLSGEEEHSRQKEQKLQDPEAFSWSRVSRDRVGDAQGGEELGARGS